MQIGLASTNISSGYDLCARSVRGYCVVLHYTFHSAHDLKIHSYKLTLQHCALINCMHLEMSTMFAVAVDVFER